MKRCRIGALVALAAMVIAAASGIVPSSPAAAQSIETAWTPVASNVEVTGSDAADSSVPRAPSPDEVKDEVKKDDLNLLNLNLGDLSKVRVRSGPQPSDTGAPSSQIGPADINLSDAATTGGLAREAPSVSTRRLSAINLDPRVRGYHSSQLNATANGMNEVKTRLDIDSVLSQIDPGIVDNITVIDGPYTSLYGPGFAFLKIDLLPVPRFENGPETHHNTSFLYGTNAQTIYTRENILSGGTNWGARFSYGVRTGNDYLTGGSDPFAVPSSYQKWDTLFAVSADLSPISRLEFDYIRCEMNNVELPGVVYDLDNSTNNQFNLTYIVQTDPRGPKDLVCQSWHQRTGYNGNSLRSSKQETLYYDFFTLPAFDDYPVNTDGRGFADCMGTRVLRTLGDRDSVQWTVGADWRRYKQYYREVNLNEAGEIVLAGGDVFGVPHSRMDDFGLLTDLLIPYSDTVSYNIGGRIDYCNAWLNRNDAVITQFTDPSEFYYSPGYNEPNAVLGMTYLTGKRKLTDETTLNAGVAFAMRMPDLAELYSDDPYVPFIRFGNSYYSGLSTLKPEKDLQFDLGFTTVKEKVSYGVRGFYALIWDYIMPVPAYIEYSPPGFISAPRVLGRDFSYFPEEYRWDLITGNVNADTNQAGYQYENVNLATLAGGDLFAEVQCRDWLSLYGSMAYVRGTNWRPIVFVGDPDTWLAPDGQRVPIGHSEGLPNIYPLNGTVAIRLHDVKRERWLIEFSSRMVAHQTNVAESLAEVPTSGFAVFALRGFYQPRENLRLSMAIENLFDKYYVEPGSLALIGPYGLPVYMPEPGITLNLGIDARF